MASSSESSPSNPSSIDALGEGPPVFSVAEIEYGNTVTTASDGDLWPAAWADDGHLYAACGDGKGFGDGPWSDLVVNVIDGHPETGLNGRRLAADSAVAPIWTDPARFNRKPTGLVAVDGNDDGADELYLVVQDLRCGQHPDAFNEAPAAGVTWSEDYGKTWQWNEQPHFSDGQFTTTMFLDLGRSNGGAGIAPGTEHGYVYAYGLDHNWRTSYSGIVPTPEKMYLARVAVDAIGDRRAWKFFGGTSREGQPTWTSHITQRSPVLHDRRRLFANREITGPAGASPIAQGGIVFNQALGRYLYSSWSEYSFEFYEAQRPWGPWRLFLSKDFGIYPWTGPLHTSPCHGGYAPTIPSKFIGMDGRDLWVQSNWFWRASTYHGSSYCFSLRRLHLESRAPLTAPQPPTHENLGAAVNGAHPIARACRMGHTEVLNDGRHDRAEDSWVGPDNGDPCTIDHWGYTWPQPIRMNRLVYVSGPWDANGGWFDPAPWVEFRRNGEWIPVTSQSIFPVYPSDSYATGNRKFTITFKEETTDGLRLVGRPGGWAVYSAIAELEVYHDR